MVIFAITQKKCGRVQKTIAIITESSILRRSKMEPSAFVTVKSTIGGRT